jgi:glucokinase
MTDAEQNIPPHLLGDIGGTHTRFAILKSNGSIDQIKVLKSADYSNLAQAIDHYFDQACQPVLSHGVIAVAAPVMGDQIDMTNHHWSIDMDDLCQDMGFNHLSFINDFTALGHAVPVLSDDDLIPIQSGKPDHGPIGVIGPGTGLGMASVVPSNGQHIVLEGEGGHVTMPARNPEQAEILHVLWNEYDHLSAERVLSGDGLINIYQAAHHLKDSEPIHMTAENITADAMRADGPIDPVAVKTVHHFCDFLGVVAGNLALTIGASGGIYLAGGILPDILPILKQSNFAHYFQAKGRFHDFLARVPIHLITHDVPAFFGLRQMVYQEMAKNK